MRDEILSELCFIEILASPSEDLKVYAVQAELLKAMKPYGW